MIKSLYDQEAIFDQFCDMLRKESKDDGITIGEARGEARGEANGARGIISIGREFGLSDSDIISRIVSNLKCTMEKATKPFQDVQADCKPTVTV